MRLPAWDRRGWLTPLQTRLLGDQVVVERDQGSGQQRHRPHDVVVVERECDACDEHAQREAILGADRMEANERTRSSFEMTPIE